ncbi:hypothetical protein IWZ00DRAFT_359384 [Phyllosticta capitalensis]
MISSHRNAPPNALTSMYYRPTNCALCNACLSFHLSVTHNRQACSPNPRRSAHLTSPQAPAVQTHQRVLVAETSACLPICLPACLPGASCVATSSSPAKQSSMMIASNLPRQPELSLVVGVLGVGIARSGMLGRPSHEVFGGCSFSLLVRARAFVSLVHLILPFAMLSCCEATYRLGVRAPGILGAGAAAQCCQDSLEGGLRIGRRGRDEGVWTVFESREMGRKALQMRRLVGEGNGRARWCR